jgi:acetylglutamate kinase
MDVVEMVLVGKVNKEIVNLINLAGGRAVGLSGKDGRLIRAHKLEMAVERADAPPEIIDLGKVGEVVGVEASLLRSLLDGGFIPVVAPVGVDDAGETYNINADAVAAAVAVAMEAKKLILLTDVPGVLSLTGELISSMTRREALDALADGTASGGMIPKLKCCLEALEFGVEKAHIVDGRVPNVVLLEMFTQAGVGTEITAD